ncbi:MAG: DMT family transporter [Promethearchaeota archaeon]
MESQITNTSESEKSKYNSSSLKGIIYASIVLIGNGIHPIINNSRPENLDPFIFVLMVTIWEFLIVIPFVIIEKKKEGAAGLFKYSNQSNPNKKIFLIKLIIIGTLFTVAGYFYIEGMKQAGSIPSSIALKSSPLYALIIGGLFTHEKISLKQILITIIMLTGLYYLGTKGTWEIGQFSVWFGILLLVPLLWIISHSITKPLLENRLVTPLKIIQIRTGIMISIYLIISFIIFSPVTIISAISDSSMIIFSFFMGITYFFMHFSWYNSIKNISISYASALVTPSPIITAVLASLLLGESFEQYHLIGLIISLVCLYGLIITNKSNNKK